MIAIHQLFHRKSPYKGIGSGFILGISAVPTFLVLAVLLSSFVLADSYQEVGTVENDFFIDGDTLLNSFFDNDDLHFRALVVPDKSILNHGEHHQTHDDFYYKMYFEMLKTIISPHDRYRIYLDIKDTRGGEKIRKLQNVLCNNLYDFPHEIIERLQIVRSSEIEILQLCDLLIGSLGAANRNITTSPAKLEIINLIRKRSSYGLNRTTLLRESKFNLLIWYPRAIE